MKEGHESPPWSQNQATSAQAQILEIIHMAIPWLGPGDVARYITVRGNPGQGSGETQQAVSSLWDSPSILTHSRCWNILKERRPFTCVESYILPTELNRESLAYGKPSHLFLVLKQFCWKNAKNMKTVKMEHINTNLIQTGTVSFPA